MEPLALEAAEEEELLLLRSKRQHKSSLDSGEGCVSEGVGSSKELLDMWERDALLQCFLDGDFDHAEFLRQTFDTSKEGFVRDSISQGLLQKLQTASDQLNSSIRREVHSNLGNLLEQSNGIYNVKASLQGSLDHINALRSYFQRIKSEMLEPIRRLEEQNAQLAQELSEERTERRVKRFEQLTQRLRQLAAGEDAALASKEARCLSDLSSLELTPEESSRFESELAFVSDTRSQLYVDSLQRARCAIKEQDHASIAESFLVLDHLGMLEQDMQQILDDIASDCRQLIRESFEVQPELNGSPIYSFWSGIGTMFQGLFLCMQQMATLEQVLLVKHDPFSSSSLSECMQISPCLYVWNEMLLSLKAGVARGVKTSTFVRGILVSELPTLILAADRFFEQTKHMFDSNAMHSVEEEHYMPMMKCFAFLQNHFVSHLVKGMNDVVEKMDSPSMDTTMVFLQLLVQALNQSKDCKVLRRNVVKGISSSLILFLSKCESILQSLRSASDMQQAQIPTLFQCLIKVDDILKTIIQRQSDVVELYAKEDLQSLQTPVDTLLSVGQQILSPLLLGSRKDLVNMICTVFDVDYEEPRAAKASPFVYKIKEEFAFLRRQLASLSKPCSFLFDAIRPFMDDFLRIVMYAMSIVKAESSDAIVRVQGDIAMISESAQRLYHGSHLEPDGIFAELNRFSQLIAAPWEETVGALKDTSGDTLNPVVVTHLLLCRTTGLPSPYTVVGWTPEKWIRWEAKQPESEISDVLRRRILVKVRKSNTLPPAASFAVELAYKLL